eukprot:12463354-Alexandrium_andersonii.AAC.1
MTPPSNETRILEPLSHDQNAPANALALTRLVACSARSRAKQTFDFASKTPPSKKQAPTANLTEVEHLCNV